MAVASRCYIPANRIILDLIKEFIGSWEVAYSISGIALEQMEQFAPAALESFQDSPVQGTWNFLPKHTPIPLSSLISPRKFKDQINGYT